MPSNIQILAAAKLWTIYIMLDTPKAPTPAQTSTYDLLRSQHRMQLQELTKRCKDWPFIFEHILVQKLYDNPGTHILQVDAGTCPILGEAIIELENKINQYSPDNPLIINDLVFFPDLKKETQFLENDFLLIDDFIFRSADLLNRNVTSTQEEPLLSSNKRSSYMTLKFFEPAYKSVSTGAIYSHESNTINLIL